MLDDNEFLRGIQDEVQRSLLAKEQLYNALRRSGEEAPAKILTVMDTGVRIGDDASMLHFGLEVFPKHGAPFRAETQNSIADTSRPKFVPGATVYVKFNPQDPTQVALDHAPVDAPQASVVSCPSCGGTQDVADGQVACRYCGKPLR